MKPNADDLLPIYRRNLKAYEQAGDDEKISIERRLIAKLEALSKGA